MENFEKLRAFYEAEGLEELRLAEDGAHYLEFLTATRYLERLLPKGAAVLDTCAGTGAYAFHLARQGHRVTAGDIVAYNVEEMREKQAREALLAELYCGDALDLSRFREGDFQAVLCMGALYHLHRPEDRLRALTESRRVLREDGLVFCTYMNRYAVILNNARGSLANIDEILTFAGDGAEDIFYASTPEEAESLLREAGFTQVRHVALDGVSNFMRHTAGLLDDDGCERWRRYHWQTCEVPSLLGSSYHNLIVGKKANI